MGSPARDFEFPVVGAGSRAGLGDDVMFISATAKMVKGCIMACVAKAKQRVVAFK